MTIAAIISALVLGIIAVQALIWISIIVWFRRKYRAACARVASAIELEMVIRPLEKGVYRGTTAPGYPTVNNNGRIALTIALTKRRLAFVTVTGKSFEIPLDAITGLRESKVFKNSVVGGRTHLIMRTRSGEIGFFVPDNAAWVDAIANVAGVRPSPDEIADTT